MTRKVDKTVSRRNARLDLLDIEEIKKFISYDPLTGSFTWLQNTGKKDLIGKPAGFLSCGYLRIGIFGRKVLAHVLAWMIITGKVPEHLVDHRDGDPLNNKWLNLRSADRAGNNRNSKTRRSNKLGVKGVQRHRTGKFAAKIQFEGKQRYLGLFDTVEEAANAYRDAAKKHYGEFARAS